MKQTIQMNEIQERMKPGIITRDGFLGKDRRNLSDIIQEQDADVIRRGLTHGQIAARMQELRDGGKEGLGDTVAVDPHFEVSVDIARGKLPCPFGHRGLVRKTIVKVKNVKKGREITYTDMTIHLIEEHGFYQGKDSAHHLEIGDIAEILDIAPSGE